MTKRERGTKGRPAAKTNKPHVGAGEKAASEISAATKHAAVVDKPSAAGATASVRPAPGKDTANASPKSTPASAGSPSDRPRAGKSVPPTQKAITHSSGNGKAGHAATESSAEASAHKNASPLRAQKSEPPHPPSGTRASEAPSPLPADPPTATVSRTAAAKVRAASGIKGISGPVESDPSRAVTVAPPGKRTRASEPRASIEPSEPSASAAPVRANAPERGPGVESAASAEPTLEVAASIAVASDRADSEAAARLARGSSRDRLREAAAFGSSESLLSTDYYFRQYGAHGLRSLAAEVDDFGFDPHVDGKVKPLLEAVCKRYFRVELVGAENIPEKGRALLVANRGGALPWDGLVLRTALRALRPELSPLRWLAEDSVIHYPFMGVLMNRLGAVRACPENAERLLAQDRLVAVFPEGAQGSRKLFRDRYRLQRFGRGGYVKLALKLGVPIFPTAIIGAEETNPILSRSRLLGRIVGSESLPITPTFPWLGLAGLLPAPVRWRIAVGEPIDLSSYGPESADDALVVHRLNEQIRSSLQALVDQGKTARGSALFG